MESFGRIRTLLYNPDNAVHYAELARQRVLCRWNSEKKYMDLWTEQVRQKEKSLFWIFLAEDEQAAFEARAEPERINATTTIGPPPPSLSFQPIGHFALDWKDYADDTTLACYPNKITFATFFIVLSMQGKGLGRATMDVAELLSARLGATTITLNTLDASQAMSEDFWKLMGIEYNPKDRINEFWYVKHGYVPYKRHDRYPETNVITGEPMMMRAVFMQKDLSPIVQ